MSIKQINLAEKEKLLTESPDLRELNNKEKLQVYKVSIKENQNRKTAQRVNLETKFYACIECEAIR